MANFGRFKVGGLQRMTIKDNKWFFFEKLKMEECFYKKGVS